MSWVIVGAALLVCAAFVVIMVLIVLRPPQHLSGPPSKSLTRDAPRDPSRDTDPDARRARPAARR